MSIGYAQGKCFRCGKTLVEKCPVNLTLCDCFKYCPTNHGRGAYTTLMRPQVVNNPGAPKTIIVCPICFHRSIPQPVEVPLPEKLDLLKVELPEKLYRKLKQVARRLKLSMDETTNLAMREGLDNIE